MFPCEIVRQIKHLFDFSIYIFLKLEITSLKQSPTAYLARPSAIELLQAAKSCVVLPEEVTDKHSSQGRGLFQNVFNQTDRPGKRPSMFSGKEEFEKHNEFLKRTSLRVVEEAGSILSALSDGESSGSMLSQTLSRHTRGISGRNSDIMVSDITSSISQPHAPQYATQHDYQHDNSFGSTMDQHQYVQQEPTENVSESSFIVEANRQAYEQQDSDPIVTTLDSDAQFDESDLYQSTNQMSNSSPGSSDNITNQMLQVNPLARAEFTISSTTTNI